MGKITAINIQSNNKNKCNIFIDGEFSVALTVETVLKNRLKKGDEITESQLFELASESEKTIAFEKALRYVSSSLKTKKQVITYLRGKGFSDLSVYYAVDKLKEYNYIDDAEYAKRYFESASSQGKRLSEYKLMMKGIKKETIDEALAECVLAFGENAAAVADKKLKNKEINKENLMKTYRYLIGRGFSYEEAEYAVARFKKEMD